jgi:hypothetical protein
MFRHIHRIRLGLLSMTLLAIWGCGRSSEPAMGEVEGVLTMGKQPLKHVQIRFVPDPNKGTSGPSSMAITDAQGRYTLQCDNNKPGAVVGHHVVILLDALDVAQRPRRGEVPANSSPPLSPADCSRVAAVYKTLRTTPLQVEVKPGKQTINLDLPMGQATPVGKKNPSDPRLRGQG